MLLLTKHRLLTMDLVFLISSMLVSLCGAFVNDDFRVGERIIGGHSINITSAPYQASYELNGQQKCGAAVISNNYALSAAHCSISDPVAQVAIRVGSIILASGGTVHKASQIINHENFATFPSTDFDISLIKVAAPFVYSSSVQAIPLATTAPKVGSGASIAGWGATAEGGATGYPHLMQAQVKIMSYITCSDAYPLRITNQMVCAGVAAGGHDACRGDAGGPLVGGSQLVGVASWGLGCGRADYPGVYASVSVLRDWVKQRSGV